LFDDPSGWCEPRDHEVIPSGYDSNRLAARSYQP